MCGRYTLIVTIEELMLRYLANLSNPQHIIPRYNIAPMQEIMAVIHDGERNRLGQMKWGLVPSWAKDAKIGSKMINARAETILEKASFKQLVSRKRCIIPADGFYEWKKEGNTKQPMRIVLKNESVFSFAGLYDTWINPEGHKVSTCTIITTTPNSLMQDIHERMPVILRQEAEQLWLQRNNQNVQQLLELLQPYPADEMSAYPVSAKVGNVKHDFKECIEPL
ncbi:SOS response-associated peptidase [Paenibacillus eucommiae]|uniref:Abasic site processing protein n=1 Tax=Paenibacillus eucommiae TaxID=1355755 RepID=A0ABS4J0V2_9BACL|nr:SOS response-associated peptidase [Paenibacillus eucommiae]MBP1992756.1 putative SOS response-associated peptidase YedK [Paenibacillus eucommiae]